MAIRANERSGYEDPVFLDTLARAHHMTGDTAQAIEVQTTALDLLPDGAPARDDMERRLLEYRAARDDDGQQ